MRQFLLEPFHVKYMRTS